MEKHNRLNKDSDFKNVYDKGKSFANRYLVIFFLKNGLQHNRVGFVTTKKLGNAVKRNLYRRRLKESFRLYQDNMNTGYDIIFLFRSRIPDIGYKEIDSALKHIVSLAGIKKSGSRAKKKVR